MIPEIYTIYNCWKGHKSGVSATRSHSGFVGVWKVAETSHIGLELHRFVTITARVLFLSLLHLLAVFAYVFFFLYLYLFWSICVCH